MLNHEYKSTDFSQVEEMITHKYHVTGMHVRRQQSGHSLALDKSPDFSGYFPQRH